MIRYHRKMKSHINKDSEYSLKHLRVGSSAELVLVPLSPQHGETVVALVPPGKISVVIFISVAFVIKIGIIDLILILIAGSWPHHCP